jgi:hypothetical protein
MKATNDAQENWLLNIQRSVRNLETDSNLPISRPSQLEEVKRNSVPTSDSIRKRLQFMKEFSVNSFDSKASNVKPSNVEPSNASTNATPNTRNKLHEQQQTGIALDSITNMLFNTMQTLPTDVEYVNANDIKKNEIRMQGVRMLTSKFSPYRNLSREVRLCTNIDHCDSVVALNEIKDCCKVVFARSVFPNAPTQFTIKNKNTVNEVNKVDVMKICQTMPVCYSPSFQMDPSTTAKLSNAVDFAENTKGLHVMEVQASPSSMYKDNIVLTPRHVGGNLLYTTSLFTDMEHIDMKNTHTLESMPIKRKHPRFGISLAHHMDNVVAHVHDKAQTTVNTWMRSLCDGDTDMYKTISSNNHTPTIKLSNTEHCAYMSPCHGMTVLVQKNRFSVASPTLVRYGLHSKPQNTMNICAVSIMFHGPVIHKI